MTIGITNIGTGSQDQVSETELAKVSFFLAAVCGCAFADSCFPFQDPATVMMASSGEGIPAALPYREALTHREALPYREALTHREALPYRGPDSCSDSADTERSFDPLG